MKLSFWPFKKAPSEIVLMHLAIPSIDSLSLTEFILSGITWANHPGGIVIPDGQELVIYKNAGIATLARRKRLQ